MTTHETLLAQARAIVERASARGAMIATAESCTGGLVAGYLTAIPGSSSVLDRGFVTYSNEAKAEMIGVDPALVAERGAVSEQVARAMAEGALQRSRAALAVSVTGVAGPGGGSARKPVGLVHFAAASSGKTTHRRMLFGDLGREQIRLASVATAFGLIEEWLEDVSQAEA